ncbi:MAG: hypothetical protein VX100_13945 [Pseudomonadota bacterium]|nr:hypothetical protein [Pseudomonadota bacterium]
MQPNQVWSPVVKSKLEMLDNIYQTYLPVCEQPLEDMPDTLIGEEKATLYMGYLERCLHRYTFSNPSLRLIGLSEIYGIHCEFESVKTPCLKSGYMSLATGKMNKNNLASIAYALFNEYVARYQLMRPKKDKPKKSLTQEAADNIAYVLKFYQNNDVESTLAELDKLVEQPKLAEQDRAYYNFILVQLLYVENKQSVRVDELFNSLIASSYLPFDEYWTIFDSYTQILFNEKRYESVIRLLANEFLKHDKNNNALSQKHLKSILASLPK